MVDGHEKFDGMKTVPIRQMGKCQQDHLILAKIIIFIVQSLPEGPNGITSLRRQSLRN